MSIQSTFHFVRATDTTLRFVLARSPGNVSSWQVKWAAAAQTAPTLLVLQKTATIVDAVRGIFEVYLTVADTLPLEPGNYLWELRRVNTGNVQQLASGLMELRPHLFVS